MSKNDRIVKYIKRGFGYTVYCHDGIYFIDTGKPIIPGYDTLQGVAEALYYGGYIDTKNISEITG